MNREIGLWIVLFVVFALYGTFMEGFHGEVWSLIGECPWIYPRSPLVYTSLIVLPLWGIGGLQCIAWYTIFKERKPRNVAYLLLLIFLGFLAVFLMSLIGRAWG